MTNELKKEILADYLEWNGAGDAWESSDEEITSYCEVNNRWEDQGVSDEDLYEFLSTVEGPIEESRKRRRQAKSRRRPVRESRKRRLKKRIVRLYENWSGGEMPWEASQESIDQFCEEEAESWEDYPISDQEVSDFLTDVEPDYMDTVVEEETFDNGGVIKSGSHTNNTSGDDGDEEFDDAGEETFDNGGVIKSGEYGGDTVVDLDGGLTERRIPTFERFVSTKNTRRRSPKANRRRRR